MFSRNVRIAKTGNEKASCFQVSSDSHQTTTRGAGARSGFISVVLLFLALASACDPVTGTGPGTPPNPKQYLKVDSTAQGAIVTLIAGYPASNYQFNYNGYGSGQLILTVPIGWHVTVQCANHATIPSSCAVVPNSSAKQPMEPDWSTPNPVRGLDPGQSASFVFTPSKAGSYRIASLVEGSEASGMWLDLEVVQTGTPTLTASIG